MASIYSDIRSALETKLAAIGGLPEIAYENVSFEPTNGTPYLRVQLIPTIRQPASRGLSFQTYYQGIFTIFCYAPQGQGPGAVEDTANTLIEAFEANTDISWTNPDTTDTLILRVDYANREQLIKPTDTPYNYIPVNIGWFIYK